MQRNAIRELRRAKGLPLEVAARLAKVGVRTWWAWEKWGVPPKPYESARRIADLLGTSPEALGWMPSEEVEQE